MDADRLHDAAAARADELPGAELTFPFGPEWRVFKVAGRVFLLLTELGGEPIAVLKSAPADAAVLRESLAEVTPGYHMNKRHWLTVAPGRDVDDQLLADLVTESYLLVVEGVPRSRRPVDPATFGR